MNRKFDNLFISAISIPIKSSPFTNMFVSEGSIQLGLNALSNIFTSKSTFKYCNSISAPRGLVFTNAVWKIIDIQSRTQTFVCIYVYMYICINVHKWICIYVCICVYICIYVFLYHLKINIMYSPVVFLVFLYLHNYFFFGRNIVSSSVRCFNYPHCLYCSRSSISLRSSLSPHLCYIRIYKLIWYGCLEIETDHMARSIIWTLGGSSYWCWFCNGKISWFDKQQFQC